ncbi:hypothetical protein Rctr197k_072 [Virus Rctr197k]|nr:hypothetical protein Rctr197k_072 [Virus Rctr197k]
MPLGDFISGGLGGGTASGSQSSFAPRVAVLFTSRLRQIAASTARLATQGLSEAQASTSTFSLEALNFFGNAQSFMPTIAMAVNPKSVKFVQPKRYNKRDTREGSVFFHFTNSKGQNNDILTLQFSGNTGNLDLRGSIGDATQEPSASQQEVTNAATGRAGNDTGALYKLLAWQNLYLMTREPMLLADGTENYFSIVYASALFPSEVTFRGFFSKVLEFEETADKPNSREYSFEFIVQSTIPDLDEVLQTLSGILNAPPATPVVPVPTETAIFVQRSGT